MNVNGLTRNTKLTADARLGLHRIKPKATSLEAVAKPLNTSLQNISKALQTHVTPGNLSHPHAKHAPLSEHDKLVKQTQTWVGQTFFGTMLKQMRESPFKSDLLDGGRGGQAFGSLYDQQLAERMSRGAGHNLVNAIVHRIEARAQAVRQQVAVTRRAA